MMMIISAHLSDAELLRLGDAEADARERAAWRRHLAECAECTDRAGTLHDDQILFRDTVTRAVDAAEAAARPAFDAIVRRKTMRRPAVHTVPARTAAAPWLRAAAVLFIVAAPVAAVPALRDWLVSGITGRDAEVEPVAAPTSRAAAESAGDGVVRFVPSSANVLVRLDAVQAGGVLRISSGPDMEARLAITQLGGEVPVYSEAGLHIRNSMSSTASYSLQLPAAVRSVSLRVGVRPVVTFDAGAIRDGVSVPLGR